MKTNPHETTRKFWLSAAAGFALIVLTVCPQRALAQTNTFPNSGNAGVGTTSPASILTVQTTGPDSAGEKYLRVKNTSSFTGLLLDPGQVGDAGWLLLGGYPNVGDFTIRELSVANYLTIKKSTGNVGIGTAAPSSKLHIVSGSDSLNTLLSLDTGVHGGSQFQIGGTANNESYFNLNVYRAGVYTTRFSVSSFGHVLLQPGGNSNVGVGTSSPGFKLDVQGGQVNAAGGLCIAGDCKTTWSQVGAGTLTGITAGLGLTGGGTSGSVTITNDDRGSSQTIFKNVANAAGATQFSAASNNDAIRFAGSGGTAVTFDAATKKVVIDGSTSTPPAANISAGQFGQNTGGGNYTFPGNVTVNGNIAAKYQDVAEWVASSEQLPTGTVVVLDSTKSNHVTQSTDAYDTRVAGVVSAQPGIALGESGANKVLVATTGRVLVKVDASRGPIRVGDLLVTSDIPGVAMKSEPIKVGGRLMHMPGTLIGKALEPLEKGSGKILVLLSLQ